MYAPQLEEVEWADVRYEERVWLPVPWAGPAMIFVGQWSRIEVSQDDMIPGRRAHLDAFQPCDIRVQCKMMIGPDKVWREVEHGE